MDNYSLQGSAYLHPTPAGTFHAVSQGPRDPIVAFLQRLLRASHAPLLTDAWLQQDLRLGPAEALEFLWRVQEAGLVQGLAEERVAPPAAWDAWLPEVLTSLSFEGRAVLADDQGLVLGSAGHGEDTAQALAALAADLLALHGRHAALLDRHLRLGRAGWGVVSPAGYSELGCWPLELGPRRFVLVLQGEPRLNQPAFTQLVWALGVHHAR